MKLVKEYINFERNLDPKDAMNIGDITIRNLNKIERSLQYAAKILKREFNVIDSITITHHKSVLEKGDIYTNELEFTHSKIKDNLFIGCNYNTVTKKIQYWVEPDFVSSAGYFNYIDECIDIYREFFKNNFEVKESVNFERGLDPKTAMDISDIHNIEYELDTLVKEFGGTSKIEKLPNTLVPNKPGWTQGTYNHKEVRDAVPYEYSYFIKYYSNSDSYGVGYVQPSANQDPEWIQSSARDCKKQIRRWILEVSESIHFKRGLSPKAAMGIGSRNIKRNFNNVEDIKKWTIENLPLILETNKIPDDIIYPIHHNSHALFKECYYSELDKYFRNYIKFNDSQFSFESICHSMWNLLHKMGYPKN